jgi:hypothetical protein
MSCYTSDKILLINIMGVYPSVFVSMKTPLFWLYESNQPLFMLDEIRVFTNRFTSNFMGKTGGYDTLYDTQSNPRRHAPQLD